MVSTKKNRKYIIVTGGVISGLGKGVTAASIGFFFSEKYNVVPIKLDGYLNSDTGTMNPFEHGEVFVLDDGFEVDMDFGHYERFLGSSSTKHQSITMGKIFREVRLKERRGDYLGKTVQMVPHVTDLIIEKIEEVSTKLNSDITLIEVGGTVGDMENELFIEALRQLERKVGANNIIYVHLTYVPVPFGVKEQKTKPTQQSVSLLHNRGVWPAIIIARCNDYLTDSSRNKIALFSSLDPRNVFSAPDLNCVYDLPKVFFEQNLLERISLELNIKSPKTKKLDQWNKILSKPKKKNIKILIAGKYTDLEDSYASIVESLSHAGFGLGTNIEIDWIDTSNKIDYDKIKSCNGIIVPGGFGSRGVEGKIEVIKFARENKIPYLGICYGLQLAVIEFARNVCNIKDATSMEIDENTKSPIITLLDEQRNVVNKGGTMRLGSYDAFVNPNSLVHKLYSEQNLISKEGSKTVVKERHRHRYEVNPEYRKVLEDNGLIISGISKDRELVEFIELNQEVHPYFVATQAHPELKSKLEVPSPLFFGLVREAMKK